MLNENEAPQEVPRRPAMPPVGSFRLESLQGWTDTIPTSRRKPLMLAGLVLLIVVGFGGFWSATAKIGGALMASGRIIAEGNNRVVQHLEGGIIEEIFVREGDFVEAGTVLARLDESASQSQLDRTWIERALSTIQLERWRAERDDDAESFSIDLKALEPVADNPRVIEAYESQIAEFQSSRRARQQELLVLDGKIANEEEDLVYLKDQMASFEAQKALIVKEETGLSDLLAKGLTPQTRVLALQREIARMDAQKSNALATIQKSHHNIRSYNDEKQRIIAEHLAKTNQRITETQQRLSQIEDVINRLKDRLRRAEIVSPLNGIVLGMPFKSIGAVVKPGEKIAEILPRDTSLQMEVFISPKDITKIFLGQEAGIIFPSDQVNVTPPLKGNVTYISADAITSLDVTIPHYIARIELDVNHHGRTILPGNVGEVFFKTEAKTLVQFIVDPITRFALKTYND